MLPCRRTGRETARCDPFWGGRNIHVVETLLNFRTYALEASQSLRQAVVGKERTDLPARAALCTQCGPCIGFDAVEGSLSRQPCAGSAFHKTNPARHAPCQQFGHQQFSSGTLPPMLVLARAGIMRPEEATPAPRAGAARAGFGAVVVSLPAGDIPRAPYSRLADCA